jgi:hypothetical protein
LVTFLGHIKKSDSRKARLSTAVVNAFASRQDESQVTGSSPSRGWRAKNQSKIKGTPPQSSPALRAREEARSEAKLEQKQHQEGSRRSLG